MNHPLTLRQRQIIEELAKRQSRLGDTAPGELTRGKNRWTADCVYVNQRSAYALAVRKLLTISESEVRLTEAGLTMAFRGPDMKNPPCSASELHVDPLTGLSMPAAAEEAERLMKLGWTQHRCPECGLYRIWKDGDNVE